MQPSKEAVEEFKEIYKKDTGKKLSNQEAYEMVSNLLQAFEAVYRPIPKSKAKELKKLYRRRK